MARYLAPLALFVLVAGFLLVGLQLDPREVPSPLIGKPAPPFMLSQLQESSKTISEKDKNMSGVQAKRMADIPSEKS